MVAKISPRVPKLGYLYGRVQKLSSLGDIPNVGGRSGLLYPQLINKGASAFIVVIVKVKVKTLFSQRHQTKKFTAASGGDEFNALSSSLHCLCVLLFFLLQGRFSLCLFHNSEEKNSIYFWVLLLLCKNVPLSTSFWLPPSSDEFRVKDHGYYSFCLNFSICALSGRADPHLRTSDILSKFFSNPIKW